jgi:hypothetical protein
MTREGRKPGSHASPLLHSQHPRSADRALDLRLCGDKGLRGRNTIDVDIVRGLILTADARFTSKSDIAPTRTDVRFVPKADMPLFSRSPRRR